MKRRAIAVVIWGMVAGIMIAAFIGCSSSYDIPVNADPIYVTPQHHVYPVHIERHDYTA